MLYKLLVSKFLVQFNLQVVTIVFMLIAVLGLIAIGLGLSKGTNTTEENFSFRAIVIGLAAFTIGAQVAYAAYKYKSKQR